MTIAIPRPLDGVLRRQLATAAAAATSTAPASPLAAALAPVRLVGERTVSPASASATTAAATTADIPVRTYRVVARPGTNCELEYDSYGDESHMPGIVSGACDLHFDGLVLTE